MTAMFFKSRRNQRLAIILLLWPCIGCSEPNNPKVVMAGTGIIPVKAWVVLGPSAGEQIGSDNNRGSRLTQAEINDFRAQLIANRKAFSPSLIITWSLADQQVINDPGIPVFGTRKAEIANFEQNVVSQHWNNNFPNIYFTGNVEFNGITVWGATADPGNFSNTPYMIINDGGFESSFGHQSPIFRLTLRHELAHYLLRRTNVSPYDGGEHVPNGSANILTVGNNPQRVMVVPSSEQVEITTRVKNGTWNLP